MGGVKRNRNKRMIITTMYIKIVCISNQSTKAQTEKEWLADKAKKGRLLHM
jgi:hypothetical protein